jgi:hypothetical protein
MDKQIEIKRSEGVMVDLLNQEMNELQEGLKQKKIEEIGQDIADICSDMALNCCGSTPCYACIAKRLERKGYRKIPENAVVLTREEKEEYESLIKLLIYDKPIKSRIYEFIKDIKDRIRKETAEKFAERLKEELENRSPIAGYDLEDLEFDGEIIQEGIDEIAKEFTEGKV